MHDSDLAWFGIFLSIASSLLILSLVSSRSSRSSAPTPVRSVSSDSLQHQLDDLQQQCLRLQTRLQQQKDQLTQDFQDATFEQLQTLLTNYPTVRQLITVKPDLPARNLSALFTPLETLLQDWSIEAIGVPWQQVAYDPQLHQADREDLTPGESVYIRFVGYRQGERILCPAKVSRQLPGGN